MVDKRINNRADKLYAYSTKNKIYCPYCGDGHGKVFMSGKAERGICDNCGHYIYRDEKTEFKYKLMAKGVKIIKN